MPKVEVFKPNHFEADNHFYPKVLNSQLHPMVSYFLNLKKEHLIERYCHLHPKVSPNTLKAMLDYQCKYFFWGGADLFYVTTEVGNRKMVVLETNSCPSGQKSMPAHSDFEEHRGYRLLLEQSFLPLLKKARLPQGALAVIYDKNYMEASGYAATLSDLTGEDVYLIPHFDKQPSYIDIEDGILKVMVGGEKKPIRAALRYVTQKPWNRLPLHTKTLIYNSTLVCLSGGRNKLLASKAYDLFNSGIASEGLKINTPETIRDVNKVEVPLWVARFGGYAVIKNPYSNAGQGVYTITNQKELDDFMDEKHDYDQFIVQSLIGHYNWSSINNKGKLFHIGTMPDKNNQIFVADLRMMVYSTQNGFMPCAIYARRAKAPLRSEITDSEASWDILGTNLSLKINDNEWSTDTSRLMQMDRKDFNKTGLGLDDLIEAYIQTVLSIIAIDKMAMQLVNTKGRFKHKLFKSLNSDLTLTNEIMD